MLYGFLNVLVFYKIYLKSIITYNVNIFIYIFYFVYYLNNKMVVWFIVVVEVLKFVWVLEWISFVVNR